MTDFQTEQAGPPLENAEAARHALTEKAFACLLATGPWMHCIGIISFAVCGFMLAGGLIFVFAGNALHFIRGSKALGLIYIASAVLCFFPARFILLAALRLRALKRGGGVDDLEAALQNNKAFWKFYCILTIACIAVIVVTAVVSVVFFNSRSRG
jgi:hypothetical protein